MIIETLDDPEKKAAILNQGDTLVIANPGTGKTTTIAYKYLYLMEQNVPQEEILCLTFTERAKAEMEERIISEAKKLGIRLNIGKLKVFTFHGFALSYLTDSVPGIPTEIVSETERRYVLLKRLGETKAFNYGTDYISGTIVPAISENIRFLKSYNVLPGKVDAKKAGNILLEKRKAKRYPSYSEAETLKILEAFLDAFAHYEKWKKQKFMDFNDLHMLFLEHFRKESACAHVLVDELQDVNMMEAEMALASGKERFAVGDRKQAIFGFQGGAYSNALRFRKTAKEFCLGMNRRSTQEILDYARGFFLENSKDAKEFENELKGLRSASTSGEKPTIVFAQDPDATAAKIIKESAAGGKSVGVIARKNRQLDRIAELLAQGGIPFRSFSGGKMSDEAKEEVSIYLRALFSEKKDEAVLGLFTPFAEIDLRKAFDVSAAKDSHTMEQIRAMLYSGVIGGGFAFIKEVFDRRILPCSISMGGEYFESAAAIHNRAIEHFYSMREGFTMGSLSTFIDLMDEGLEPKTEESGVSLLTVHKAKGMEFDTVVYLPSAPGRESVPIFKIVSESILESLGMDAKEEIEGEDDRVDFVALTRAEKSLSVIIPADSKKKGEMAGRYAAGGKCEQETSSESVAVSFGGYDRHVEAWKCLLAGNVGKAQEIIDEKESEGWLGKSVSSFFNKLDHISFSSVSQASDAPYEYLINRVFGLSSFSESSATAQRLGSRMHNVFEMHGNGIPVESQLRGEDEKAIFGNFLKCMESIRSKYGDFKFFATEQEISEGVKDLLGIDEDIKLTGRIDAILEHKAGYLVIDYKTDKKLGERDRDHRKQLEIYRKAVSMSFGIPIEKISYAVVYVNLRGNVNTGEIGHSVEYEKADGNKLMSAFAEDAKQFFLFRKNPGLFIDHVFEKGPGFFGTNRGYLLDALKAEWDRENNKRLGIWTR